MKIHMNEMWLINHMADYISRNPEVYQLEAQVLEHSCTGVNSIITHRVNDGFDCATSEIYSKHSIKFELEVNNDKYTDAQLNSLTIGKTYRMLNKHES